MPPVSCEHHRTLKVVSVVQFVAVALWIFAGPAAAQDNDTEPTHPTLSGSAGISGVGIYQPNHWGLVQTYIVNETNQQQNARMIFRFDADPQHQFTTTTSLPPKTRRQVVLPVFFSGQQSESTGPQEHKSTTTETILTPVDVEREHDRQQGLVRLVDDPTLTAVMSDNDLADDEAISVLAALRKRVGLSRGMAFLPPDRMIRHDVGYDGVHLMALTADTPQADPAQRRALRRWLSAGGTLLIFADQVESEAMQLLLGDAWNINVFDQLSLTELRFDRGAEAAPIVRGEKTWPSPTVVTEQPITMTRLTAPDYDTLLEVRDWPALISRRLGQGRILVSTLGGRAWTDPAAEAALDLLGDQTLPQTITFAGADSRREQTQRNENASRQFVTTLIGYRVISRDRIAWVFGIFVAVMLAFALLAYQGGRLEWLGPGGVVAALIAAGVLVTMGTRQRGQVPPTVASLQHVQPQPGIPGARLSGTLGVYDSKGTQLTLASRTGGWAWPPAASQSASLARMMWNDIDHWHWADLDLAAGAVRPISVAADIPFDRAPAMNLTFGPDGLTGNVDLPGDITLENMIIATPQANLALRTGNDPSAAKLRATPATVLPRGVFTPEGLIGEAEQARSKLLEQTLVQRELDGPVLLGFSKALDTGITTEPSMRNTGQALWRIPLRIQHAEPGTQVTIPWPLVSMQHVTLREQNLGLNLLPIYRADRRTWLPEISGPSAFVARFQVPRAAQPLEATTARVHLNMNAIGRPVRIVTLRGDQVVELAEINNPAGPRMIDIPVDQIAFDETGGVLIGFDVQNPPNFIPGRVQSSDIWSVNAFGLELTGTVQATPGPRSGPANTEP